MRRGFYRKHSGTGEPARVRPSRTAWSSCGAAVEAGFWRPLCRVGEFLRARPAATPHSLAQPPAEIPGFQPWGSRRGIDCDLFAPLGNPCLRRASRLGEFAAARRPASQRSCPSNTWCNTAFRAWLSSAPTAGAKCGQLAIVWRLLTYEQRAHDPGKTRHAVAATSRAASRHEACNPQSQRDKVDMLKPLRVLLLADDCNPDWPSLPVVGYNMARAIAEHANVTLATHVRNRPQLERDGCGRAKIEYIDNEYVARRMYSLGTWLRGGNELGWTMHIAASYPSYLAFEHEVWRRFGPALRGGGFDVVHRLTPMSPTLPSPLARLSPVPFVLGPLNGGLPWPADFTEQRALEKDWLARLRDGYRLLPFYRSTYQRSAAILTAFRHTLVDLPEGARERAVNFPEVGVEPSLFHPPKRRRDGSRLTFLFVGRLVPYKLPQVVVDSFARSAALHGHRLLIVGDGPERESLEKRIESGQLGGSVQLLGRRSQAEVGELMRQSDVFVFPSIRELGAGVVAEAMASGLCCVATDYGGPAELLEDGRGVKVALGSPEALTQGFTAALERLVAAPDQIRAYGDRARDYALSTLTWDVKARFIADLYDRLLDGRGVPRGPLLPRVGTKAPEHDKHAKLHAA